MGKGGGRRRDDEVRKHFPPTENGKVKCEYCGEEFAASTSVTRMRDHINKMKGRGIEPCSHSPQPNKFGSHKPNRSDNLEHNLQRHQGHIQDDAENQKRIQVYSSFLSNGEKVNLHTMKRFVFECLRAEDKIFISPLSYLTQEEFITLKPEARLDSLVIDIFVEILTNIERKKKTMPSNWYLPVTFLTAALSGKVGHFLNFVHSQKIKEHYMSDLESCEKIFIPVHIGARPDDGHFYLYIIHLKNKEIEIWDSLSTTFVPEIEREETTAKLLFAMEKLYEQVTFTKFHSKMVNDLLLQPNGFDCGIFVINYMKESNNYVKRNPLFKFDSDKEREDLALKLLNSDLNQEKQNLYDKAIRHYAQIEKQNGSKRLRIDASKMCIEDVGSEAEAEYDGLQKGSSKGYILPTTDLIGKKFQRDIEQIWEWIMDDKVSSIGIWGIGGSGKTALATHIHNKLILEEASSDTEVIWATVSQKYSISHLQKVIARSIKLDISCEFEVRRIAGKLLQAFREMKNRVIIILDDVWDHFFLKEVGFPMLDNQITIILTTRIWDVCQGMDCKENIIEVESLDDEDSFALFEKFVELHDGTSLEVKNIARDLSHNCRGLPLAIVRIATSMKGKTQASEWSHTLDYLKNLGYRQYEMDKWVLPVLRSSYDFLNNTLQRFFLYCTLSTDRTFIDGPFFHSNCLVRKFAYASRDEKKTLWMQYNEGYNMLDKLQNHSMLKQYDSFGWRIHAFLRFMAIGIAENTGKIMANAYENLTQIPSDDQWKEDLQKVFLTGNKIGMIPNGTCPRCSQLSTLLLDGNENLNYIPDDFFNNMPVLKTLDMSYTSIKSLPESVSSLKYLVTLLLSRCRELICIPSLKELKRLIALDLSYTSIMEAPMGLEALVNLRHLNLLGRYFKSPASHISKLINLEWLEMHWILGLGCIQCLEKLEVIVSVFSDISIFNSSMSYLDKKRALRSFDLALKGAGYGPDYVDERSRQHHVKRVTFKGVDLGNGEAILPRDIKELFIKYCNQEIGVRDLCKFLSYDYNNNPHKIELLDIEDCDGVEYLCCLSGSCPFCSSSQLVGRLDLEDLKDLKYLVSPFAFLSLHESSLFSHLTNVSIWGCHSIESVLTPKLVELLQNLHTIDIGNCKGIKEIVGEDHFEKELTTSGKLPHPLVTLPNLTSLKLWMMPQLNYLYRGVLICPSLRTFSASFSCKQLDSPQIKISSDGYLLPMYKTQSGYRYHWQIESC